MPGVHRIGLWLGPGVDNALAARAALGPLQAEYPGADWVLLGPRHSYFLFEMDERVPVYIPLRSLEPRRPAQSRLSYYFEKRAQFKKLRDLRLNICLGVSVPPASPGAKQQLLAQFQHVQKMLSLQGDFVEQELSSLQQIERPLLQAGPQALAYATRLYRQVPPHLIKAVMLLDARADQKELDAQWLALQNHPALSGANIHLSVAAIDVDNRLLARHLNITQPHWLQLGLDQAIGLMAYADRVICASGHITRICSEMGRADRLVLVKSHT